MPPKKPTLKKAAPKQKPISDDSASSASFSSSAKSATQSIAPSVARSIAQSHLSSTRISTKNPPSVITKKLSDAEQRQHLAYLHEFIVKYIDYDDQIKEETKRSRETIHTLKDEKNKLESSIIQSLDVVGGDTANYTANDTSGRLVKVNSVRKGPINKDIIKNTIIEDMIKNKIWDSEQDGEVIMNRLFETMEAKRDVKNVVKLKRMKAAR